VIEVKATFNKVMVEQAANKLLKLRQFQGKPGPPPWNRASILPDSFRAAAVFFETKVKNPKEYSDALTALAPLWQTDPLLAFIGALILRGQGHPEASAKISYFMCGTPELKSLLADCCEASDPFEPFVADACGYVVSGGFDKNEFWEFMIDLVHALNGDDNSEYTGPPKTLTGGYGIRRGGSRQALFPAAAKK